MGAVLIGQRVAGSGIAGLFFSFSPLEIDPADGLLPTCRCRSRFHVQPVGEVSLEEKKTLEPSSVMPSKRTPWVRRG